MSLYGTAERAWTYDEYVEKYEKLQAKNIKLKKMLAHTMDTVDKIVQIPPCTAHMQHCLGIMKKSVIQLLED